MNILGVFLVYAGLVMALMAAVSVVKPIRFLGFHSRVRALLIVALGLATVILGMILPAPESRATAIQTRLDEFVPVYQFHEVHRIAVHASPAQCYAAIRGVRPEEISLFGALTWIRRLGRGGHKSIVNAPPHEPLIETATRTGFLLLADDPDRELVNRISDGQTERGSRQTVARAV